MKNYTVDVVKFRVAREAGPPRARFNLSDPGAVAEMARSLIPDDAREHFGVFLLDSQNHLIAYHEVSVGTLSASLVHPREVLGPALRVLGVASLILVHNHPSGDPAPSREDVKLTRQLVDCANLLDMRVIIGNGTGAHASLAERGEV